MIEVIVFMYQLFGTIFNLIIPVGLILGVVWILVKMLKAFVRSIVK